MLIRHAKSDRDADAANDFDRPLAKRGRMAAKQLGAWMKERNIFPDYFISSPALRARQTVLTMCGALQIDAAHVFFDDRLYLADVNVLLSILPECPKEASSVLLVGHNPGLEDLLTYLCGEDLPISSNGKLMPTAALAQIILPDIWQALKRKSGQLIAITRPKDI